MISSIYTAFQDQMPGQIKERVKQTIEKALGAHDRVHVFFRADDIGVPSKNYNQMMDLFVQYQTPLCLAVVPAWLTRQRWDAMAGFRKKGKDLFCWHMHGFMHKNHEPWGKKQEFGPSRSSLALFNDLSKGQARLHAIMGNHLTKVFTPPWNRCSPETLTLAKQVGFKGISRHCSSLPAPPPGLADLPVHVDLHTRREKTGEQGWQNLLTELANGMATPLCGIMIHHMRMNPQAFLFLAYLLELLSGYGQINCLTYKDLI